MKKYAGVFLLFAGNAFAQIPVTDGIHIGTSISNQIETVAKWAAQYEQMVESIQKLETQIQKAQNHYNAITGSRGKGALLDQSSVLTTALPADWKDMLSNIKSSAGFQSIRKSYPTSDKYKKVNDYYDIVASHDAVATDLYSKSNEQIKDIKKLLTEVDKARDPAAKSDLLNRIAVQQSALQANRNMVALMEQKQNQELKVAGRAARNEYICRELGNCK